jgi:hypothetical protein
MALAIAGQARVWLSDRGMWLDEVYVAVNLKFLPTDKLAGALLHRQVTPPGWLVVAQQFGRTFDFDDVAMRTPAFLGAAGAIVAIGLLAWRSIGRVAAFVAVVAAGLCAQLTNYAGEVKQYSAEALGATAVVLAAGWTMDRQRPRWQHLTVFAGVALAVAPFSYPALLVLVGTVGAGGLYLLGRRDGGPLRERGADALLFGIAALPGALVSAQLIRLRLRLPVTPDQYTYFYNGMPPAGSGLRGVLEWLPRMWDAYADDPIGWRWSIILLLALLAGLAAWVARGRTVWAAMILGVFVVALGAAAAGKYPLASRVALYLVGLTVVGAVAGVDGVVRLARHGLRTKSRRMLALVLPAVMLVPLVAYGAWPTVGNGLSEIAHPLYKDPVRDVLADVRPQVQPGDVIFVYYPSLTVTQWYGTDLPITAYTIYNNADPCPQTLVPQLRGVRRVWWVHGSGLGEPVDMPTAVIAQLARYGTLEASRTWPTPRWIPNDGEPLFAPAGWALFDLTKGADGQPPAMPTDVTYTCFSLFVPPQ